MPVSHTLPPYDHTTTLLEDVFTPSTSPYVPVYVIDFKVAAHFISNWLGMCYDVSNTNPAEESSLRPLARAMWAYRLNLGSDVLGEVPFTALVADDLKGPLVGEFAEASSSGKGYWRHIEAHKLDMVEYKGGRGEKTSFFNMVQEEGYEYIRSPGSSFHYFAKEFFEADDIAGHVCRLKRAASSGSKLAKRQMFLITLDGDWQGLASDPHGIYWANTGPWLPRLRSEREVCDYYLRKEGMHITSAKGCYDFKVEYGDAGDNLKPGTPLRFFDLYGEDSEWGFSEEDTKTLLRIISDTKPSNNPDHFAQAKEFILRRGVCLPHYPPAQEGDKKIFFERARESRAKNSHPDLVGRNRTLCMEKISEQEVFLKCKELALEDEKAKEEIKKNAEILRECRKTQDKKCVKDLLGVQRNLRNLRAAFKDQLSKLVKGGDTSS